MKRYYFYCKWKNGANEEYGAVFSEDTPYTGDVRELRGIQPWVSIFGPYSSEERAERAKEKARN